MPVFVQRQHLHGNVPGRRILLQMVQHRPAQHVGQEDVERDGRGMEFAGQRQRFRARHGDQHLESLVARQIAQHARVVRIVFDNQQDGVVRLQIRRGRLRCALPARPRRPSASERRRMTTALAALAIVDSGARRAHVGLRQVERERAALAGRAAQLNFAAQQVGQFAADGQAQAGAAVFAAGAGIGLLEGLEDDALLFRAECRCRYRSLRRRSPSRRRSGSGDPALQPLAAAETDKLHAALLGELEGIGQQVLQHLLQALRVGDQAAGQVRIGCDLERRACGSPPRGGTGAPPSRAGCRRRLLRPRPKPCPIRSSTDRECR